MLLSGKAILLVLGSLSTVFILSVCIAGALMDTGKHENLSNAMTVVAGLCLFLGIIFVLGLTNGRSHH